MNFRQAIYNRGASPSLERNNLYDSSLILLDFLKRSNRWFKSLSLCLLSFCLNTTQFVFEGIYYKQVFGTAMGFPVSALIANLVMEDIECRALTTAPGSPSFWKRFVDDVISAVSENEIVVILQLLNSIEPSIHLTVERETSGKLPFLNTCVQRTTDGELETVVYRKPTHTDKYSICHLTLVIREAIKSLL